MQTTLILEFYNFKGTPSARKNRWDETPHSERFSADTPGHGAGWAETPRADRTPGGVDSIQDTPSFKQLGSQTPNSALTAAAVLAKRRSRWDETPMKPGSNTPSGITAAQVIIIYHFDLHYS